MSAYLEQFFKGIFGAALTDETPDPSVTSLLVGSVAVANRKGLAIGVATFFLGYAAMATLANVAASVRYLKKASAPLPPRP